jgi:hypothetical protein
MKNTHKEQITMIKNMIIIKNNIKFVINECGLTINEVCDGDLKSKRLLWDILSERRNVDNISLFSLLKVANILGCSLEDLLCGIEIFD